ATSDAQGRFSIENLAPRRYTLSVSSQGFKPATQTVVVEDGRAAAVEVKLEVAGAREELNVAGKAGVAPNSDPNYRALRDASQFETFTVKDVTIKRDAGTLTLTNGTISFLSPVMGRTTMAVFVGAGEFELAPSLPLELDYLRRLTKLEAVKEPFGKAVLSFTDDTYQEVKRQAQAGGDGSRAKDVLGEFRNRLRMRTDRLRENIEADVLAGIYNPYRQGFFKAFIFGKKHDDLRFIVRPGGALPDFSPEEVGLLNATPGSEEAGIWYLAHFLSEYKSGRASSEENKRVIHVSHYKIETVIDNSDRLTASAEITFIPLAVGDRVLSFDLLPALRVTRVSMGGAEIGFIQEKEREAGSFHVITPERLVKGREYTLTVEYQGHKVVADAGGGNFAVGARTSWYPSVNAFNDRATFDLTFKVPKQYTLVGVGKLVKQWNEGGFAATQWVSEIPLAVAGFNYGLYKKRDVTDPDTKYQIETYATSELPSNMREYSELASMTPSAMAQSALVDAQNSLRLFSKYFGEAPYGRIAITQQPAFNFGQSWPTLVYLPVSAFLDSTQRYLIMGGIEGRFTEFIEEVGPHEVSHQWWGHMVGWASYHDQWLSEGFADFSAGLFLQMTQAKPDKYLRYWERQKQRILEKNRYGLCANDAGPIWMGFRLSTFRNRGGYANLVYPKGGYILHMLRSIMHDGKSGDQKFIDMMRDFVKSRFNENASTESFKSFAEKHMTPAMDLDHNGKLDWFFNQWVYGTEIPSYRFEYTLTPDQDGKVLLNATLTQSGVSDEFKMLVPVYLDVDGKMIRLGLVPVTGNKGVDFKVKLSQRPKRVLINAHHDVLASEVENKGN
ncbi:MAG TPA: M1 family aminopeptidase, partial [Candidatus Solibacter sp.]|nr:M1 family aminopeptidase [Candidatus Solibacter sp.]